MSLPEWGGVHTYAGTPGTIPGREGTPVHSVLSYPLLPDRSQGPHRN